MADDFGSSQNFTSTLGSYKFEPILIFVTPK